MPVSAIATVQPVSAPSTASSSTRRQPVVVDELDAALGATRAGSPAGTTSPSRPVRADRGDRSRELGAATRRTSARYSPTRWQKSSMRSLGVERAGAPVGARDRRRRPCAADRCADPFEDLPRARCSLALPPPPRAEALAGERLEVARSRPAGERAAAAGGSSLRGRRAAGRGGRAAGRARAGAGRRRPRRASASARAPARDAFASTAFARRWRSTFGMSILTGQTS